ncbi:hypothetical protein [Flavobacterium sp. SM2513]|uniref:hypothetical protein n=1 Tax=Flavobacterium sp. SM2513 TaxID=3424766 RepID=UPI003D7F31B8
MLKDECLRQQLPHLIQNFHIQQVFYHPGHNNRPGHLLVHTANYHEAVQFSKLKWVKKMHAKKEVLLHFAGTSRLQYCTERGNPFVPYYYEASALIYQNPDYNHESHFTIEKKSFLKKLRRSKNAFFHDYDLLSTEARRHRKAGGDVNAFLAYHSIFSTLIHQLEGLYISPFVTDQNLHERIAYLTLYLPELQRLFVKKSAKKYCLIEIVEAAALPGAADGELYLDIDMLPALEQAAEALYVLVEQRYKIMKRGIHFPYVGGVVAKKVDLKESLLGQAIGVITKIASPEEIYLFHTKETAAVPEKTAAHFLFYVLLLGKGIGNDKLLSIQQSVADVTQKQCTVVAIAHSRYFIQDNLFSLQTFFKGIIQPENRIYTSDSFHPMLHWQASHTVYYSDLGILQPRARRYSEQFQMLLAHRSAENTEALYLLFAYAFTHLLRTYLYLQLFSYQPNQLCTYSLWNLAVYSNPKLEKMEFLFNQLSDQFYKDIDAHLRFAHRSNRVDNAELEIMEQILNVLVEKTEED